MLDGEDIEGDFSWYLDLDGDMATERFRELLFSSIEKHGEAVTDRIPVGTLRKINDVVKRKVPIEEQ